MKKLMFTLFTILVMYADLAYSYDNWSDIATSTTGVFDMMGGLMQGISYLLGFSFLVGSIVKFADHRQNPSQTPLYMPGILLIFGLILIGLPFIANLSGQGT